MCGVYACDDANAALFYAHRSGSAVVGRTKLWGRVVEHEAGWRAERAYPESVYVPREHFEEAADDVAAHLARRYGVPVHVVDELRSVLLDPDSAPTRRATSRCRALPEWVARRVRPQPLARARPEAAARPAVEPPRRRQAGTGSCAGSSAGGADGGSSGSGAGTGSSTGSTTITRCGSPISTRRCYHRAPAPSGALPTLFSRGRSTTDRWPGGDARAVPALPVAAGTPVALAAPRTRRVGDRAALSRLSPGLVRARADGRREAPRPGAQAGPHRAREAPRGDRPDRLPGAGRGLHLGPATATRSCRRTSGLPQRRRLRSGRGDRRPLPARGPHRLGWHRRGVARRRRATEPRRRDQAAASVGRAGRPRGASGSGARRPRWAG